MKWLRLRLHPWCVVMHHEIGFALAFDWGHGEWLLEIKFLMLAFRVVAYFKEDDDDDEEEVLSDDEHEHDESGTDGGCSTCEDMGACPRCHSLSPWRCGCNA